MKIFNHLFLILLGLNITACNRGDDDVGKTEDFDIQREEEYKTDDIRDHELDLDQ